MYEFWFKILLIFSLGATDIMSSDFKNYLTNYRIGVLVLILVLLASSALWLSENFQSSDLEIERVQKNVTGENYEFYADQGVVEYGGYNFSLDEWASFSTKPIAQENVEEKMMIELGNISKNISVGASQGKGYHYGVEVEYNLNRSYPFTYEELDEALPNLYKGTIYFDGHSHTADVPVIIEKVNKPVRNLANPRNQTAS